ncbi:S9 family peptidase [Sphingomonas sp. URHD0057]|uniref:S9 family peptidase n=1 Tax=Sphingomonas sp. URHD0057 TaxID=1380389 RepID=UPI0006875094|nr:S9 family peptidase [Sphingomonas sp. URHD0057]
MKSNYLAFAVATTAICASPTAARPIAVSDINNIRDVSAPAIDPSGTWVAYQVGSVDVKADKAFTHLWMTSWDGARTLQLTSREKESESTPRWSPDGRYLGFISSRTDKHDNDQLWLLDRTGGEARPLTKVDGSVVDYAWSPNGRQIALIVLDPDPEQSSDDAKDDDKPPKPIVIDRFQFKRDIEGYLSNRRQRLMLLDVASGQARRLVTGDFDDYLPAFSPDGSQIAFVSNRDKDPDRTYNTDLWVVPTNGAAQAPTRLTIFAGDDNDPDYSSYPAWSPDGRSIAYIQGGPVELFSYGTRHLAVVPASGGEPRVVTASLDRNVGNPIWSADGKSLRIIVEDDKAQYLASVPASGGAVRRLTTGKTVVWAQAEAKGHAVALAEDFARPPEVFALDGTNLRRISRQNDAWLADVQLAPVEDTVLHSKDGTEVHGFLVRPLTGANGRVPTVLRLHGGPQSQFDYGFTFEWQLLAANGYAVVAANPRGGTGFGQDYAKALYADWGGVAVPDVLAAVDDAVARGIADPNRLGVGGWSYGGMLTNYTIASDPRFKAATSGASISNILAGYGTDQYIRDYEVELGKPWEHLDVWMKNSYPFYHVDKIVTPTLFQVGDKDFNVPLLNSEQMYQALKSRGVPTELVIYPGQYHGLKRPSFLRDRYQRYLDWYAKYLK